MKKIVINRCYGGFSLSEEANELYSKYSGKDRKDFYDRYLERDDPILIRVVEELGEKANGGCAELYIEELEYGTFYRIDEYDGLESIQTKDEIEWKVA